MTDGTPAARDLSELGAAYLNDYKAELPAHGALLEQVRGAEDVGFQAARAEADVWSVTIAAADRVGMLSIINGVLASHDIDIVQGDVFTMRAAPVLSIRQLGVRLNRLRRQRISKEAATSPPRVLVAYHVRPAGLADDTFWSAFRAELKQAIGLFARQDLSAARETFIERSAECTRRYLERNAAGTGTEKPVSVAVEEGLAGEPARLRISGPDARGFLFEFTNALAMLNVNIERLSIRTEQGRIDDTVWVTDARGEPIRSKHRLGEISNATVLIVEFMRLLPRAPDPELALAQFVELTEDLIARPAGDEDVQQLGSEQVLRTLAQVLGFSEFLWDDLLRLQHENLFPVVCDIPALNRARRKEELAAEIGNDLRECPDIVSKVERFNEWKDREMFRIDLRHITANLEFHAFADELSDLADVAVEQACSISEWITTERHGTPQFEGRDCPWCACGAGKLGGRELGFGSDIELLFVYQGAGKTNAASPIHNSDYFERFVADFRRTVRAKRDGIFEVDMRLRPYGSAGPNASTLRRFEEYFRPGGPAEQFQRLALTKLRAVTGDRALAGAVLKARDAFVYSDLPIDYDDIVKLRRMQQSQLVPTGQISAKHSAGGLVDIEYFVQAKQIESGRTDPRVRLPSTRRVIAALADLGHFDRAFANELLTTYGFLRQLIDALRVVRGHAKDLTLPRPGSRSLAYLARRLRYATVDDLQRQIEERMQFVRAIWARVGIAG